MVHPTAAKNMSIDSLGGAFSPRGPGVEGIKGLRISSSIFVLSGMKPSGNFAMVLFIYLILYIAGCLGWLSEVVTHFLFSFGGCRLSSGC